MGARGAGARAWLALWPPQAARYPEWLQQRLGAAGLALSAEALGLLAASTEGNLLAAQQEIDKLLLRFGGGAKLSLEQLAEAAGENARFEVGALSQAIAEGDAVRALRVLAALRAEGDEPVRILWWLVRALHGEARVARAVSMSGWWRVRRWQTGWPRGRRTGRPGTSWPCWWPRCAACARSPCHARRTCRKLRRA